nr:dual specificity protein phosphatase 23 isoform X3 [Kogia breviceps]
MGVQPPNFSWVLPGRLAGLALPRLPAHYQFLLDQGVRHLVSLTERRPPHSDSCPSLTLHRLRIPDFCSPGPEQIDLFVKIVDEANARGELTQVRTSLKEKNLQFQAFRLKQRSEGFPGDPVVESLPADKGDTGSCPGPGRSHMPRSG